VALYWTDLATNELGYIVERSIDGLNFGPASTNAADSTSALDPGLLANTTYFYRVRALDVGGLTSPSTTVSVTTVADVAAPQAPSGLIANGANGGRIVLHWLDQSANEARFLIERSTDSGPFVPIATVGANVTYYVDGTLAPASSYSYRVRSFNSAGESAP